MVDARRQDDFQQIQLPRFLSEVEKSEACHKPGTLVSRCLFCCTTSLTALASPGSFRAPPPGRPVTEPYDKENLKLGTKVDDLHHPVARKNFRVVVIRPQEVEQTDLSDPETARRYLYTYEQDTAEWKTQELWP